MLVPKLRFKEFSGEWEAKKLREISQDISYGMNSASTDFDGINKYIRITDIDEKTSLYINNPVSPLEKLEDRFLVRENDILFARTGASTGKTYLYDKKDGKMYFAGFLIRANIKNEYNSIFIFEQTKLNKYNNWIKIMSMRSGQPGINSIEYGNYIFSVTSKLEQEKIATFLSLLDKKIELQQRKIDTLKEYKRGLTEKLFNNLKGEKINLKELIKERNEYSEKGMRYSHVTLSKEGIFPKTERYNRDFLVKDAFKKYKITKMFDLCYNPANLKFGVICLNRFGDAIFSPIYVTFEVNKKCNPEFIGYYLCRNKFINYIRRYEQGTVYERMAVNSTDFLKYYLKVPSLEEQNNIVNFLNSFECKIKNEEKNEIKLNEYKKGLLQQMFI